MSNDEIAGKLSVLEVFTMTALGLYLANASNDPDYLKAKALLNWLRDSVSVTASPLAPAAQKEASRYAGVLLESLSKNIRTLRGEPGRTQ